MAHKTLINGTAYEISGGKTLVNSTAYEIKNGKTLVGGTAYDVGFNATVTISVSAISEENPSTVTIGETTYTNKPPNKGTLATLIVPIGTEIYCVAYWGGYASGGHIYVNGTQVAIYTAPPYDYNNTKAVYTYTVTGDVSIEMRGKNYAKEYFGGDIYITEL